MDNIFKSFYIQKISFFIQANAVKSGITFSIGNFKEFHTFWNIWKTKKSLPVLISWSQCLYLCLNIQSLFTYTIGMEIAWKWYETGCHTLRYNCIVSAHYVLYQF